MRNYLFAEDETIPDTPYLPDDSGVPEADEPRPDIR